MTRAKAEDYFREEGIDLDLVTGYGADKTMTALLTGEADIGFMGSEASIYTYLQGSCMRLEFYREISIAGFPFLSTCKSCSS